MENNNLARALFGKLMFYTYNAFYVHNRRMRRKYFWWILLIGLWTSISGNAVGPLKLDWLVRQKICSSIARGLALLHEESILKIVHKDIKSVNLLLDGDFNPKISDFGLGKLYEKENIHISTRISGTVWATFLSFAFYLLSFVFFFFPILFFFITSADLDYKFMWIDIDLMVSSVVLLHWIW